MYHPPSGSGFEGSELEFVEIYNAGENAVDLSGAYFNDGIVFTFPDASSLDPGEFLVIVSNTAAFQERYSGVSASGEYEGQLDNSGERVQLLDASGQLLFVVDYRDSSPWPSEADGAGKSLVLRDPSLLPSDEDDYSAWRASSEELGSPARPEPSLDIVQVVINEVLTHTDLPLVDAIELHNPTGETAEIGGWYLSDQYENPKKYRIPNGSSVSPDGYFVVDEIAFGVGETGFSLNSHGEPLWLFSADENGNLTGYSYGVEFGASDNGVSFGRYVLSTGETEMVALSERTLGSENVEPLRGEIVVSEIYYDPSAGGYEYIELLNTSGENVRLYDIENPANTWRINGLAFDFPSGLTLQPNQMAVVTQVEPSVFREYYGPLEGVMVLGPYAGALDNAGERISLQKPDSPDLVDGQVFVPYIDVDVVDYNDKAPWPVSQQEGACIERVDLVGFGRDADSWALSYCEQGSPGWVRGMSYEVWKRAWFSDEDLQLVELTVPTSDFDEDGEANLWEYATGGSGRISLVGINQTNPEGGGFEMSVRRSLYPSDVVWNLWFSDALGDSGLWEERENEAEAITRTLLGDGSELIVFKGEIIGEASFFRLGLSLEN
ncbi:lamin tail domain-containing protein [Pelagicoccus mobilis]|uniref:Lamin tail domain-containing protein n=2 Tax=Pelagicoccus mobilis TaxID=415221 RepID=A0A934RVK5_9BACT|nr:lamin tail domain-containing protein [Pelagicoccus mobilis]